MPVEELKAVFVYLACAFGQLNPFGAVHCTNSWASAATQDRLGCKVRPHFAVNRVAAETDVAGIAGMLLCALVDMVFVMSVRTSHLNVQQNC